MASLRLSAGTLLTWSSMLHHSAGYHLSLALNRSINCKILRRWVATGVHVLCALASWSIFIQKQPLVWEIDLLWRLHLYLTIIYSIILFPQILEGTYHGLKITLIPVAVSIV